MGVGSLSLLQHIFLTQELNQSLLHYRQILYILFQNIFHIVYYKILNLLNIVPCDIQ